MTFRRTHLWMCFLLMNGCSQESKSDAKNSPARGARPFPVQVQTIGKRDVTYTVNANGSVVPFEMVQVTARVTGVVEKVLFREGDVVKAGQPLIEIDPKRFELAVASARAMLKKAQATAKESSAGLARRETASKEYPGLVAGEEFEAWRARDATAVADVAAAQVALDRAELDRRDAYVRAPVAGVLQTRTVNTGQFVQPGTVLATLVQRDPLLLRFEVPPSAAGVLKPETIVHFTADQPDTIYDAKVTLVATTANPTSRLVPVTAVISDPKAATLQPGSFAQVTVELRESSGAVVIPQTAVRASEKGFLAYVVKEGKAEERVLQTGMRTSDGFLEVKKGLQEGEQLVIRGAEALRSGAPLDVQSENPSPESKSAEPKPPVAAP